MADRARHAFGTLENVDSALSRGVIDAYDILFLKDANGKPCVGWIDSKGQKVIVEETEKVVTVEGDSLPASGESGKIYIFGEDGYFWDGAKFINLCKPTDVSELENQISGLETEMDTKVDAETVQTMVDTKVDAKTVQSMIEEHTASLIEVVEF